MKNPAGSRVPPEKVAEAQVAEAQVAEEEVTEAKATGARTIGVTTDAAPPAEALRRDGSVQRDLDAVAALIGTCADLSHWGAVDIQPMAGSGGNTAGGESELERSRYYRVRANLHGITPRPSSVVARFDESELAALPDAEARPPFVDVALHLERAGLAVPHIFGWCRPSRLVLMSDLGETSLADAMRESSPMERSSLWRRAVQQVVRLQHVGYLPDRDCVAFRRPHAQRDTRQRLQALVAWAAEEAGRQPDSEESAVLNDAFDLISETLHGVPQELAHADMRADNLMVADDTLWVTGFGGARIGPFAVDLAALLVDPARCAVSTDEAELVALYAAERARARLPSIGDAVLFEAVGAAQVYVSLARFAATRGSRVASVQPGGRQFAAENPVVAAALGIVSRWFPSVAFS